MTDDTSDDDRPQPTVPVPPDIDEWDPRTAYLTGAAMMADNVIHAMQTLRPEVEDPHADPDAQADDEGVCRTCGAGTVSSMGAPETEHSPKGVVCPSCDDY